MTKTHDAHYLFDSASTPGQVWTVQYVETATGWELQCNCPAAHYYRKCWHLKAARDAESGKPAAEQPAPAPKPAGRADPFAWMYRQ